MTATFVELRRSVPKESLWETPDLLNAILNLKMAVLLSIPKNLYLAFSLRMYFLHFIPFSV
jgi:hypothetical protein